MKRRTLITTGATVGLTFIAGCGSSGPGGEPRETETEPPTTEEEPGGMPGGNGGLTAEIEPSASEIAWGEEYSVTVTLEAGEDYPEEWAWTDIGYSTQGSSGKIKGTDHDWDLPTGQSVTHTFEFGPPATGEITFTLHDLQRGSGEGKPIAEWTLTVEPPVAALGETIPYYDGLEVTMDARLTETIEAHIFNDEDEDLGVYSIRPKEGKQWALAMVTATNTSNTEIYPPDDRDIAVLSDGTQLNQVGGLLFAHQNDFRAIEGNPDDAWLVELDEEVGYYDPPNQVLPTASTEGWLPFLAEVDVTKDDIAVILARETSLNTQVTARWG